MVDRSQITSILIIATRRTELFKELRKNFAENRIPVIDNLLENSINKIENRFFISQSETRSNAVSDHIGIRDIIRENPDLIKIVSNEYLKELQNI